VNGPWPSIRSHIKSIVEAQHVKPVDYTTRRIAANESRIDELKRELAFTPAHERGPIRLKLAAYGEDTAKLKQEQADAARQAKYESNRTLQLAIEHAEGFLGTPPAGADPIAVQTAVAILDAGFDDPEVAARTYWNAVADISDAAHQRRASEAAAKTAERHKAEADEARAHVAELESRRQTEQARELAGGGNE
jgi:hypothetical protein